MEESIDLPPNLCYPSEFLNTTTSFSRTARKRVYSEEDSATQTNLSSDPALFSSDEPAASAENYASKRRKQVWEGTWWGEKAESRNANRTFTRNFDSGVFLSSDSADSDFEDAFLGDKAWKPSTLSNPNEQNNPLRPKQIVSNTQIAYSQTQNSSSLPKNIFSHQRNDGLAPQCPPCERVQEGETLRLAKSIIMQCVQDGRETVDLSSLKLGGLLQDEYLQLKTLTKTSSMQEHIAKQEEAYQPLVPDIKLFLANNQLRRLGKEIFEIENLVVLSVRQNELKRLPDAFRRLTRLEELNVSGNQLDSLPYAILNLIRKAKLRKLSTFPNPFKEHDENERVDLLEQIATPGPTLVAESRPTYYWKNGRLANVQEISRQVPQLQHGYMDQIWQSNRYGGSRPVSFSMQADHVPSLVELALVECSRQEDFFGFADCPGEEEEGSHDPDKEFPASSFGVLRGRLRHESAITADMLRKGQKVLAEGGKSCSVCGRNYIIQRVSWYEWHRLMDTVALPSSQDAERSVQTSNVIPFYCEGCSFLCYLRRSKIGMPIPESDE